jgi:hypothetical protein
MKATHSSEYRAVLMSEEWRALSHEIRRRGRCAICEGQLSPSELQAHHLHYENLGAETLRDLLPLCDDCHFFADKHRAQLIAAAKAVARDNCVFSWEYVLYVSAVWYLKLLLDPRSVIRLALLQQMDPGLITWGIS